MAEQGAAFCMTLPNDQSMPGFTSAPDWHFPGLIPMAFKLIDGKQAAEQFGEVTFTATGLGDVLPLSPPPRVLVMLEQFAGIGYLATAPPLPPEYRFLRAPRPAPQDRPASPG